MYEGNIAEIVDEVVAELERGLRPDTQLHGPMFSAHEGIAILQVEVDELWEEVKEPLQSNQKVMMKSEAIQVAATAIRFILDCCPGKEEEEEKDG